MAAESCSRFGANLNLLFEELGQWNALPANFDDSFFDKLVDYFPQDEETLSAVDGFLSQTVDSDLANLVTLHLCLRLCEKLVDFSQNSCENVATLLAKTRRLERSDPALRESVFKLADLFIDKLSNHAVIKNLVNDATLTIQSDRESVFVQRSAQKFLTKYLQTNSDSAIQKSLISSLLNPETKCPAVINAISAVLNDANMSDFENSDSCTQWVNRAKLTVAAGESFWKLISSMILINCEDRENIVNAVGSFEDWMNKRGRLSVIKHLICSSINGSFNSFLADLLMQDHSSLACLIDSLPYICPIEHRLKCAAFVTEALGADSKSSTRLLRTFLDNILPTLTSLHYTDAMKLFDLVQRKAMDCPDLLKLLMEGICFDGVRSKLESLLEMAENSLDDQQWEVRDSALELIAVLAHIYLRNDQTVHIEDGLIGKIEEMARNDNCHFVRASAFRLLSVLGPKRGLEAACKSAVSDSDPLVRRSAVFLLNSLDDFSSTQNQNLLIDTVSKMDSETDVEVKLAAVKLCERLLQSSSFRTENFLEIFQKFLDDCDMILPAFEALERLAMKNEKIAEFLTESGVNECDVRQKLAFLRNPYAVEPSVLLADILASLKNAAEESDLEEEENLKDCY